MKRIVRNEEVSRLSKGPGGIADRREEREQAKSLQWLVHGERPCWASDLAAVDRFLSQVLLPARGHFLDPRANQ